MARPYKTTIILVIDRVGGDRDEAEAAALQAGADAVQAATKRYGGHASFSVAHIGTTERRAGGDRRSKAGQ